MLVRAARVRILALVAASAAASMLTFAEADSARPDASLEAAAKKPQPRRQVRARTRIQKAPAVLDGFNPLVHRLSGDMLVSELAAGRRAELTLDPSLQSYLEKLLARYEERITIDSV